MFQCNRCGERTPRLTLRQTRCPRCEREVQVVISIDEARARRARRFGYAKDLTPVIA